MLVSGFTGVCRVPGMSGMTLPLLAFFLFLYCSDKICVMFYDSIHFFIVQPVILNTLELLYSHHCHPSHKY